MEFLSETSIPPTMVFKSVSLAIDGYISYLILRKEGIPAKNETRLLRRHNFYIFCFHKELY